MVDQVVDNSPDDGDQEGHSPTACQKPDYWPQTFAVNLPTRGGGNIPIGASYQGVINGNHVYALMTQSMPAPAVPITLTGTNCDGTSNTATGNSGQIVQVVQAPDQVLNVRFCKDQADYEKTILCDSVTGHKVAVITTFNGTSVPTTSFWDINTASAWTGDPTTLEMCTGEELESDSIEMCDSGTTFIRWVVKSNGAPTGDIFDTDISGLPYYVSNPSSVTIGKCIANTVQSVSSVIGDDLTGLQPGTSFAVYKDTCCSLKLKTSVGDILIPKTATSYSTQVFKTPFTIDAVEVVSGTCDLANVTIISNLSA